MGFLLQGNDLDLVDSVINAYRLPVDERVDVADKAIDGLRQSALRLFRR